MGNKGNNIAFKANMKNPLSLNAPQDKKRAMNKNDFEFTEIIGRGGFGKVWKVFSKKDKKFYAGKEMSKLKIIDKRSPNSIKSERDLLSGMFHPFIINMWYAFQDQDNIYGVLDYLSGGDFRYHLCKQVKMSEEQTKFIIACIVLALEYVHSNNIIHRDLKPENLVFDDKGYIKLTDFGIAKPYSSIIDNSNENSGTPGYMAPEVLCGGKHNCSADFFALGVIAYECMTGVRPYSGKNKKDIKEKILMKQVQVTQKQNTKNWSDESVDFINRGLIRKPNKRGGYNSINEVKEHSWLKFFNWKDGYLNKINACFIPPHKDNFDYKYCNEIEKHGVETQYRYIDIKDDINYVCVFQDYLYYDRNTLFAELNKKSRNRSDIISKSDMTGTYLNPHLIYQIGDEKEEKAFNSIGRGLGATRMINNQSYRTSGSLYERHFEKNKNKKIINSNKDRRSSCRDNSNFFNGRDIGKEFSDINNDSEGYEPRKEMM